MQQESPHIPPGLTIHVVKNHHNEDDDEHEIYSDTVSETSTLPPGLVLPRGFVRRLSMQYSAKASTGFDLLKNHKHLSIMPSTLRNFYNQIEKKVEQVSRQASEEANKRIDAEILEECSKAELPDAIETMLKGDIECCNTSRDQCVEFSTRTCKATTGAGCRSIDSTSIATFCEKQKRIEIDCEENVCTEYAFGK